MRTMILSFALTVTPIEVANAADCSALQIENSIKTEPLSRYGLMTVPITLNGVEKKFRSTSAVD